jgi:hypothetical protein
MNLPCWNTVCATGGTERCPTTNRRTPRKDEGWLGCSGRTTLRRRSVTDSRKCGSIATQRPGETLLYPR